MPFVTVTVARPKTPAFKAAVLKGVHDALIAAGVPPADRVVDDIVRAIAREPGVDPEHVMIVFKETAWENWSFGGGRILHA